MGNYTILIEEVLTPVAQQQKQVQQEQQVDNLVINEQTRPLIKLLAKKIQ